MGEVTKTVQFDIQKDVGIIRLNRPQAHNAVNAAVIEELEQIVESLEHKNDVRFLILTGTGKATFCAGGDLKYFATLKTRSQGMRMSRRMCAILDRLAAGPQVVVAAVNGSALGGGCEILTACHFRIAASNSRFAFRQAANGLTTGWGGGIRLFHLLGRTQALRLFLTAETISAEEAHRIGLLDRVVPRAKLLSAAQQLVSTIRVNSPGAVSAFLDLATVVNSVGGAGRKRELEIFGNRWTSDDFGRSLSTFLKGRTSKP
jgi:enoyl-CoA hydratase/carnithine racemase